MGVVFEGKNVSFVISEQTPYFNLFTLFLINFISCAYKILITFYSVMNTNSMHIRAFVFSLMFLVLFFLHRKKRIIKYVLTEKK